MKQLVSKGSVCAALLLFLLPWGNTASASSHGIEDSFEELEWNNILQDSINFDLIPTGDPIVSDGQINFMIMEQDYEDEWEADLSGTNDYVSKAQAVMLADDIQFDTFDLELVDDVTVDGTAPIPSYTIEGLGRDSYYKMFAAIVNEEEVEANHPGDPDLDANNLTDYENGTTDQFKLSYNGTSYDVSESDFFLNIPAPPTTLEFFTDDNSNGANDVDEDSFTFDVSNLDLNQSGNKEWLVTVSDNNVEVQHLPGDGNLEILSTVNGVDFNTYPFPEQDDEIGGEDPGITVSGASNVEEGSSIIRGVTTDRGGEMRVRFEGPIDFVEGARKNITLINRDTEEDVIENISINNDTLIIDYERLDPEHRYLLTIPELTLSRDEGTRGKGQFNQTNEIIVFDTEKKPNVLSTSFSPSNQMFDHERSPFRIGSGIYEIDDLIGVHAIGVGVNQALAISFDDPITNLRPDRIDVATSPVQPDLDYDVEISPDNPNELLVTFDTNHPDRLLEYNTIYEITVEAGAVTDGYGGSQYAQNEEMNIRFKTADGFNQAFLNRTANSLNNNILRTNSRNIAIDIPNVYIEQMETIHYADGMIPNEREGANLTNVEVLAHDDVDKVVVNTNVDEPRTLERGVADRFSATFAGLNSTISDIHLTAYDEHGKVLERRSFRLQGAPGDEFRSDYVPEITGVFGQTVSLYELMSNPGMMQQVLEQIPVSELDRIGVFYPYFAPYDLLMNTAR